MGSEVWLRDGDERRDITSIAQARADRVTQACVGRRTRRGVIWCLLLYHRTSGCTWSAFLTGWTPPTTVKGHCDTLCQRCQRSWGLLCWGPLTHGHGTNRSWGLKVWSMLGFQVRHPQLSEGQVCMSPASRLSSPHT